MNSNEYLKKVLEAQSLPDDSAEMWDLREHREAVEAAILGAFGHASPTIRYGGSKAKGTLVRETYDLDIVCYFPSGENGAGGSLREIYENVRDELSEDYVIEEKTSAIRLKSRDETPQDFHIDVVPGRFTDDSKSDCYLYQRGAEKDRLKTNLDRHIAHIRDSGVTDAIRLLKLLRHRRGLHIKQFAFELLIIKLLTGKKAAALSDQLLHVLSEIAGAGQPIGIEDPANPYGNHLIPLLRDAWSQLRAVATATLETVRASGWEGVFGGLGGSPKPYLSASPKSPQGPTIISNPPKPWTN